MNEQQFLFIVVSLVFIKQIFCVYPYCIPRKKKRPGAQCGVSKIYYKCLALKVCENVFLRTQLNTLKLLQNHFFILPFNWRNARLKKKKPTCWI